MAGNKYKPDDPEVSDGKVECYWCERNLPAVEMKQERHHGTVVYVCKGCQGQP
jgi:hypothetical protein